MGKVVFKLPDIGEGIVEGEIVKWLVKKGVSVDEDEPLVEIMTDKATVSIPSPHKGKIVSTSGKPGDMIAVGAELLVFDVAGVKSSKSKAKPEPEPEPDPEPEPEPDPEPEPEPEPEPAPIKPTISKTEDTTPKTSSKPLASPAIRRKAREAGVNLEQIKGTGPAGRITNQDFEDFIASGGRLAAAGKIRKTGTREVKVIGLRRKISEKMSASKRQIPHFTYFEEVEIEQLEELRTYLNNSRTEEQPKLTYLPFIMQALVKSLLEHPECNATFDEQTGTITQYDAVNLGIATQTPEGLKVPVVQHVESLDVWQSATETSEVTSAARDGTASLTQLTGSTFTITSLGAMGGLGATPIINHPEVAILGIHKAEDRVVVRDGEFAIRKMMNLSASFDHRIIDGYNGALLIQTLKSMIEHPATIFM